MRTHTLYVYTVHLVHVCTMNGRPLNAKWQCSTVRNFGFSFLSAYRIFTRESDSMIDVMWHNVRLSLLDFGTRHTDVLIIINVAAAAAADDADDYNSLDRHHSFIVSMCACAKFRINDNDDEINVKRKKLKKKKNETHSFSLSLRTSLGIFDIFFNGV